MIVDKPLVMGIINATPDSFYERSRYQGVDKILKQAEQMLNDGADILDIGGQSTRPGCVQVDAEEELNRVINSIAQVRKNFTETFISIDTFYSKVAKEGVSAGADIVNDISAGSMDQNMIQAIATLNVPYVLMHMQNTPQTMQADPQYENVTREVLDFFAKRSSELVNQGIIDVIIDPGFGFGKTIQHNLELLRNLSVFTMLDKPILLGISRKSTICKTLGTTIDKALNGTTVLNTIGLMNGASILRVHDVKEAKEAVRLYLAVKSEV